MTLKSTTIFQALDVVVVVVGWNIYF